MFPRKTAYSHPHQHYAAQYRVNIRTVRRWAKKGYPLDDPKLMASVLAAQKNGPASFVDSPDLEAAKLKKMRLECERIYIQNQKQRSLLISRDEVHEARMRIGSVLHGELAAFLNDMPCVLAGLSQIEVRTKLGEKIESLKEAVRNKLAK